MKTNLIILVSAMLLCAVIGKSQSLPQQMLNKFEDAEFFFQSQMYTEALFNYNAIYQKGGSANGNINYRIGLCYMHLPGQKSQSVPYLEKAVQRASEKYIEGSFNEINAPIDAIFYLGQAYRATAQFDKGVDCFERFKQKALKDDPMILKYAENEIAYCRTAPLLIQKPNNASIQLVGKPISTGAKDYFPAVSENEQVMVFNLSQRLYEGVMFSRKTKAGTWGAPQNISSQIQTDGNQFVSSLSADGTKLILRKEDGSNSDIYISEFVKNRWTESEPIKAINSRNAEPNASISKDGNTIYFSSNRKGTTGELDLYKAVKQANGKWGQISNLGNVINTEFNEDCPIITENGKRLYFISQGHNSMGGFDIFYSDLNNDGSWSTPQNVGYPINTCDDEVYYFPIKNGSVAYTSRAVAKGIGNDDIVRIEDIHDQQLPASLNNLDLEKHASILP